MKRIFTLVFALGFLTAAQAQNRNGDNRGNRQPERPVVIQQDQRNWDNDYSNDQYDRDVRYMKSNPGRDRKMAKQIDAINREYDFKMQQLQRNRYLSRFDKQRQLRFLQEQRQREIRMVYARNYKSKHKNNYDDRDDRFNNRF